MISIVLHAPFAGWAAPLAEAPDPVFAERMMGDGIALDPFEGEVRAPCDAVIAAIAPTRHSVTLRAENGAELLIHVGIDTVALGGDGFEALVVAGERVRLGQPLLRVDLDRVLRGATSLVTPMVVVSDGFGVRPLAIDRRVAAGEPLAEVTALASVAPTGKGDIGDRAVGEVVVPLAHGLHARPAARIGAALKPFVADVRIACGDRVANARSVVALLGLGVAHGDRIAISAQGAGARAAVAALIALIEGGMGEAGPPPALAPPPSAASTDEPGVFRGVAAAPGLALGVAWRLHAADLDVPAQADDPIAERARLDRLLPLLADEMGGNDIAEAHAALLGDPELIAATATHIAAGASAAGGAPPATRG